MFHIKRKKEEEEEENPIFGTKHDKYKIDIYRLEYNSAIGKGISKIAGKNKSGEKNEKWTVSMVALNKANGGLIIWCYMSNPD